MTNSACITESVSAKLAQLHWNHLISHTVYDLISHTDKNLPCAIQIIGMKLCLRP